MLTAPMPLGATDEKDEVGRAFANGPSELTKSYEELAERTEESEE